MGQQKKGTADRTACVHQNVASNPLSRPAVTARTLPAPRLLDLHASTPPRSK